MLYSALSEMCQFVSCSGSIKIWVGYSEKTDCGSVKTNHFSANHNSGTGLIFTFVYDLLQPLLVQKKNTFWCLFSLVVIENHVSFHVGKLNWFFSFLPGKKVIFRFYGMKWKVLSAPSPCWSTLTTFFSVLQFSGQFYWSCKFRGHFLWECT